MEAADVDTLIYDDGPPAGAGTGAHAESGTANLWDGGAQHAETLQYDDVDDAAGGVFSDGDVPNAQGTEDAGTVRPREEGSAAASAPAPGRRSAGQLNLRAAFAASAASSGLGLEECGGAAVASDEAALAPPAGSGGMLSAFNLRQSRWQSLPEPGGSLAPVAASPVVVDASQASPMEVHLQGEQAAVAGPSADDDWGQVVQLAAAPVSLLPSGRAIFAQLPQCWLDFSARSDALGTRCLFASRRHEHSVFAPLAADELIRLPLAASGWQPPLSFPSPPADAAKLADEEPWSVEIHPGQCAVRVLLRPAVLLLRMLRRGSSLPSATFSWRAVDSSAPGCAALADEAPRRQEALGQFSILSNVEDAAHPQPPHFKEFPLRREQLRSLGWMVSQERRRREPFAAELRETVPCADAPHWKLQGCMRCEYRDVKGGVLADAIGYGKTACTIGLIDATRSDALPEVPSAFRGFLPSRATLVLAPTNLHQQWLREIIKFTGNTLKVLSVPTYSQLKKFTEQEIRDADVIVATYRLFYSVPYLRRLEELARSIQPEFAFPSSKGGHGAASARQPAEWAAAYRRAVELLPAACGAAGLAADPTTPDETPEQAAQLELGRLVRGVRPKWGPRLEKAAPARSENGAVAEASASAGADASGADAATQPYAPCSQPAAAATPSETAEDAPRGGGKRRLTGKQPAASQPIALGEAAPSACPGGRPSLAGDARMRYLPLEAFWWRRVVCDEFHELLGRYPPAQVAVETFRADYKWGLSGTPPCQTLAQIRRAAGFLGVQLPAAGAGDEGGEAARRVAQDRVAGRLRAPEHGRAPPSRRGGAHRAGEADAKGERALYLALTEQQRPLPSPDAPSTGAGDVPEPPEFHAARQSASGLLKLCSHFCASGAADVLTAEDRRCQRQLALRRERLRAVEREARSLADRAANTAKLVRHFEPHWCRVPDPKDYPYLGKDRGRERLSALGCPAGACKSKADLLSRLFEQLAATGDEGLKDRALRPDFCHEGDAGADCTGVGDAPAGPPPRGAWSALEAAADADGDAPTAAGAPGSDDEAAGRERIRGIAKDEVLAVAAAADARAAGGGPLPPRCARLRADLGMPRWPTAAQLAAAAAAGGPDGEKGAEAVWHEFRQADWAWRASAENAVRLRRVVGAWRADAERCAQQLAGLAGQLGARLLAARSFQQTLHASQQGAVDAVETRQEPTRRFAKYGSKIEAIVRHVQRLQKEDKGCKIICFVQWEDLKRKVAAALDEFKLGNLTLSGSVWKRRAALTQFQYEEQGPRLLLLSLEESASGTNLTAANHVIIVHPMEAATKEEAVAFEMQAVGRVRRPGQRRKIHIWRFVTVDTIEQAITEEHQLELWERQQAKVPVTQPGQAGPDSSGDEAQLVDEDPAEAGQEIEGGGIHDAGRAEDVAATQEAAVATQ
ncbi:unnamed protein product, partial [Prorocentrum cordatum]